MDTKLDHRQKNLPLANTDPGQLSLPRVQIVTEH